jgi:hypothetical protein
MNKHVLAMGAGLAILVSALVIILRILNVISRQEASTSLGKILSVIVVSVVAIVVTAVVVRLGKRESAR